ncbi:hypothetical protein WOC76_02280 [Methylocystis sp. IM3]|uniref:hypothetical protein n=1 Tax=unclassified Methylocystis TaxID=2625913 RepID=UPI0030F5356D
MKSTFLQEATPAVPSRGAGLARLRLGALCNYHVFLFASFLFLLPNLLFATALRPLPGVIVVAASAGAFALLWRGTRESRVLGASVDAVSLAFCLAGGVGLCLLGGEGHFFYSTADWLIRDAVLADLVRNGTKVIYRYGDQDYLLRAPLGMYLSPAVVGRMFGLYAAHLALLAQNAVIVGAILYLTSTLAEVRKAPFILLMVMFSGLDILGVLAAEAVEAAKGEPFKIFSHIEWWSAYFSPVPLQYSSFVTQLFWVPNHMAPGWWFALIVLLHVRGEIAFSALLAACLPLLLWSPLAMLGAAPFVAWLALRAPGRGFLTAEMVLAAMAGLCFAPVALYLVMDAGAVPHEWLAFRDGFLRTYFSFVFVEIPQAAVLVYAWRKIAGPDRGPLVLALVLLLVIPLYSFGPSNDFAMRASIPALFLLAFSFARIAVLTPRDNSAFPTLISSLVLISAATPLLELKNAFSGAYGVSDCNMMTAWRKTDGFAFPTNYLAREEKVLPWLISVGDGPAPLTVETRRCWPDHPLLDDRKK